MEPETDNPKKSPSLRTVTSLIAGLVLGAGAYVAHVGLTIRNNVANALLFDDAKIAKQIRSFRKLSREALEKVLPEHIIRDAEETNSRNEAMLNDPDTVKSAPQREAIRNAMSEKTVLGKARIKVLQSEPGKELVENISLAQRAKNRFLKLANARADEIREATAYGGQHTATITEQVVNEAHEAASRMQDIAIGSKRQLAGMIANEVPLAQKMSMQELHFTSGQKTRSGLVFGTVSAIAAFGLYKLSSMFGNEKSDFRAKR